MSRKRGKWFRLFRIPPTENSVNLLDLTIILVFLLLVAFAKVPLTVLSVAVLVGALIVERFLKGERIA